MPELTSVVSNEVWGEMQERLAREEGERARNREGYDAMVRWLVEIIEHDPAAVRAALRIVQCEPQCNEWCCRDFPVR